MILSGTSPNPCKRMIHSSPNSCSESRGLVNAPTMSIPDDIGFAILSKLSLKSLKRFTLVHKSWTDVLETTLLYKHRSSYDDASLLLLQQQTSDRIHYDSVLYLLSGNNKFEKLDWPPLPSQEHESESFIRVLGSGIRGTLCLLLGYKRIVLWNLATKELTVTPSSPRECIRGWDASITCHGFGYDPVRDDFKVIRHIEHFPGQYYPEHEDEDGYGYNEDGSQDEPVWVPSPVPDAFWEIYSLKGNSWRKLDYYMLITGHGTGIGYDIYTNGMCHWLGSSGTDEEFAMFDTKLGSFNFCNEVFFTTLLPLELADRRVQKFLVALNESIAVMSKHDETTTFHIWILGELGVEESWIKLSIVGPLHDVGRPIGVGKKGDLFFRKENGKLALFDFSTQILKEMVAKGLLDNDQIIIYEETILFINFLV